MSRIQTLYQLQLLDSELDRVQKELADTRAALGESQALKRAKATAAAAEQKLRQAQTKVRDLELEVNGLATKIAQQEKLLYSGKTMSAKEAANLQDEVTSLRRWHGAREELLLEAMVAAEEAEESSDQAQASLTATQRAWTANQAELIQKQNDLETKIAELETRRPTIVDGIQAEDLQTYQDLRRRRAGRAVAAVKNGVCQGCGVTASNSKIQRARAGQELTFCGTCGRILYAP